MKRLLFAFVAVLVSVAASAQETVEVKGTVLDENGWPLTGAYVLQQGTSNGTLTDLDGNFVINAPKGSNLEFTFMGYLTQVLPAQTQMNVTMQPDALMMEEVVVVGYGTQKSKDLTAPIVNVKGDALAKQATANPMSALSGMVSGVQITQSGAPGAGPSVKIRGVGSIGDYANPLYVVDGAFMDNIDFLASSDIESLTVLKDASAAAIYGVRAANGVIIVTTKKGQAGHIRVTYDGYAGVQVPTNIMKLTNTEQYCELYNMAFDGTTGFKPLDSSDYKAVLESAEEMKEKKLEFSKEAQRELGILRAAVKDILELTERAFKENNVELAAEIEPLEQVVDDLRDQIKRNHILRLQKSECTIEHGFVLADLLNNFERVSDHCSNVGGCVIEISSYDALDMHKYLASVRHGSEAYDEQYKEYSKKYSI